MELSEETRYLIQLLAAGKKEEAKAIANAAQARIRATQAQLEAELAVIQEITRTDAPVPTAGDVQTEVAGGASSKAERRQAVLSVARNLATSKPDGLVTTDAIYSQMRKDGIPSPTKTGIGVMLNAHKSEWERVDKGLYRLLAMRSATYAPPPTSSSQATPPMVPYDPGDLPF